MSNVLIATIAGLVTAFCWGTSDWLSARGAKKLSPIAVNFGSQVTGFILCSILLLFADIHLPSASQLVRIVIAITLLDLGYMTFVKALASGTVGVIVPIGNSYPLVTLLLSVILLGDKPGSKQLAAFFCIILGAAVLAYEKNPKKVPLRQLHRETLLAVIACFIWGTSFFLINPLVGQMSWQELIFFTEVWASLFAVCLIVAKYRIKSVNMAKRAVKSRVVIFAGATGSMGLLSTYLGAERAGSILIPAVLSSSAPLVASMWGAVIDKEILGVVKRIGTVIVVAGIVLLNTA
jgi:drug/metabolite transporter (DMT)-like permease